MADLDEQNPVAGDPVVGGQSKIIADPEEASVEPSRRGDARRREVTAAWVGRLMRTPWARRVELAAEGIVIVLAWCLLTLPIVFYYLPNDTATVSASGQCEQVDGSRYTGTVCREHLQSCLNTPGAGDIYVALTVDDQVEAEQSAMVLEIGLDQLQASDECRQTALPFVCLYLFGLCGDSGTLHSPSSMDCLHISTELCVAEWAAGLSLGLPLPECSTLPEQSTVICGANTTASFSPSTSSPSTSSPSTSSPSTSLSPSTSSPSTSSPSTSSPSTSSPSTSLSPSTSSPSTSLSPSTSSPSTSSSSTSLSPSTSSPSTSSPSTSLSLSTSSSSTSSSSTSSPYTSSPYTSSPSTSLSPSTSSPSTSLSPSPPVSTTPTASPASGTSASSSHVTEGTNCTVQCRDSFYCTVNNTCKPRCGSWEQHSHGSVVAVDVVMIISASTGVIAGAVVFIITGVRRKELLVFPSIIVQYMTAIMVILCSTILVSYFDKTGLFCSSIDLQTSIENTTPFCTFTGVVMYYTLLQLTIWWFFHVAILFWEMWFPFHARRFKLAGRMKFLHVTMAIVALFIPVIPVVAEAAAGRFAITRFPPILCTGTSSEATFYALVLPIIVLFQVGITLLILIFRVIHKHYGPFQNKNYKAKKTITISSAEKKIFIVFCYYVVLGVITLTSFSFTTRKLQDFTRFVLLYFACELNGINPDCDRSTFEKQAQPALAALSFILLGLFPAVNLIYVINIKKMVQCYSKKKHYPNARSRTTKKTSTLTSTTRLSLSITNSNVT